MNTLDRREFLKMTGLAAALSALAACRPLVETATPSPTATAFTPQVFDDEWLLRRTLQRITFGVREEEVERARQIGLDNFIDEQLYPDIKDNPDPGVPDTLQTLTTLTAHPKDLLYLEPRYLPVGELILGTLLRAAYSQHQLYEMMVDFWTNHFHVNVRTNAVVIFKNTDDREVIRPHALGNFGDMLIASAHSPAMLLYLDNAESTKDIPNENYARELMELHTLGVDGGYTQFDVEEVARALTGWSVAPLRGFFLRPNSGEYMFRKEIHDDGTKLILGSEFPSGQGETDGDILLEMLIDHPSTAEFVSSKLVRRFVSDQPPAALVARTAETFKQTRGDIPKVMSTILHSEEFKVSLGLKLKRPLELFVSALRTTNANVVGNRAMGEYLNAMGQPLFQWATPDGFPDYAEAWANTSGLLARWNYALMLSFGAFSGATIDWTNLVEGITDIQAQVDALSLRLSGEILPPAARQIVLDFVANSTDDAVLETMGALILGSPYFQFR